MSQLPEPNFINRDADKITQAWIDLYEQKSGKVLQPAQIERLMIDSGAYRENLLRVEIQRIAKENLLSYAPLDILEHIGEPLGVQKLLADAAVTTLRFSVDDALGFDFTIPKGTEIETKDGLFVFETKSAVILRAGELFVDIEAICQTAGVAANNYALKSINNLITALSYISNVENIDVSHGGADDEDAESLRERIKQAPESFSNAGSKGAYKFHTLSAHQSITDVAILSQTPGIVEVYPLWLTQTGVNTGWMKIEFRNQTPKFKAFCINARNSADANTHSPCDFIIEGSNDDTNWTLLGQYSDNLNWGQNERRYFGLTYFDKFKYYRISITKNSGAGAFVGFGALEFFESKNDYMPMVAKLDFSIEKSLLINNGIGMSTSGKTNQLSVVSSEFNLENLYNNSYMFIATERQEDNCFKPVITTAQPVYSQTLQKYSVRNSIPTMISFTTSSEFNYGYSVSASSFYSGTGGTFYPFFAFNHNWANKWLASVAGGNQWLQFDFPNYRRAARFTIIASADQPAGCIKNGFIKGFNGEEWIVLKEIKNQVGWYANEVRNFDVDIFEECTKFKLEITEIENPAINAQLAQFEIYELAHCFVIPENKFYFFNQETQEYETREINFIGRIKTQNNFVIEAQSYAIEHKTISEDIHLALHSTYMFNHNLGLDYKNIKTSAWIKDKTNGFIMPWNAMSILDSSHEWNNNAFYIDDCLAAMRTGAGLMQYRDYNGTNRSITGNCSIVVEFERNF